MKRVVTFLQLILLSTFVSPQTFEGPLEYKGRIGFGEQKEGIKAYKFLPDGKSLVLVGKKTIQTWNLRDLRLEDSVAHDQKNLEEWDVIAVVDPEGQRAVIVDSFSERVFTKPRKVSAAVIDLKTGKQIRQLERPSESVRFAEWSRNGNTLVTLSSRYSSQTEICFWNGDNLELGSCRSIEGELRWNHLSDDGKKLFVMFERTDPPNFRSLPRYPVRPILVCLNTKTGGVIQEIQAFGERYRQSISPDETLFVGNDLGALIVWNVGGSNAPLFRIEPRDPSRSISFLGFTRDSEYLIAYQPSVVEFYSTRSGKLARSLGGIEPDSLMSFHMVPDGTAFGFDDCEDASFYDLESGKQLFRLDLVCKTEFDPVSTSYRDWDLFRFHSSGKYLLTASDKMNRLWDMGTGSLVQSLVAPERLNANREDSNKDDGLTRDAGWTMDGKLLFIVAADRRSILLWELEESD